MMCNELVNLLADYLDGSMDPVLREELEGHIELCDSCMNFLKTYDTTRIVAREARVEEIPLDFRDSLKRFILGKIREGSESIRKYDVPEHEYGEGGSREGGNTPPEEE